MAGQRAKDKVQIGAYIDVETDAAVRQWLEKNPRKTKTDFLFEAISEKLKKENIKLSPQAGSRQHLKRSPVFFNVGAEQLNDANFSPGCTPSSSVEAIPIKGIADQVDKDARLLKKHSEQSPADLPGKAPAHIKKQ